MTRVASLCVIQSLHHEPVHSTNQTLNYKLLLSTPNMLYCASYMYLDYLDYTKIGQKIKLMCVTNKMGVKVTSVRARGQNEDGTLDGRG